MKDFEDIRFMPEYNQWCAVQPQGKKLLTYKEWVKLFKLLLKK